jgi:hypothetical protein
VHTISIEEAPGSSKLVLVTPSELALVLVLHETDLNSPRAHHSSSFAHGYRACAAISSYAGRRSFARNKPIARGGGTPAQPRLLRANNHAAAHKARKA